MEGGFHGTTDEIQINPIDDEHMSTPSISIANNRLCHAIGSGYQEIEAIRSFGPLWPDD